MEYLLDIRLGFHFTTQCFDLMTGLNDVKFFSSQLQKALDVHKLRRKEDRSLTLLKSRDNEFLKLRN
jgi:hypothetical protein